MNDEDKQVSEEDAGTVPDAADEPSAEERLAEAEHRAGEFHEQMLRARAELENTRKRADKEIERNRKYAVESFAAELLEIKDNLERGLSGDMNSDTVESVREGVNLTLKSLEQVFVKFGVREVSPMGQMFDPELHQAMSVLKTGGHMPNTVIEVVQKGYLLGDRLLRPAMVVVAAPEDQGVEEEKNAEKQEKTP